MKIASRVMSTQAKGCWLCVQIGTIAFYFTNSRWESGHRLEILTPCVRWRFHRGSKHGRRADAAAK